MASTKEERSKQDSQAPLGIATTNISARSLAATGQIQQVETIFKPSNSVCKAGVLFFLPSLLANGLLQSKEVYKKLNKAYYGLMHIVLLLAYMALTRIKKTPNNYVGISQENLAKY